MKALHPTLRNQLEKAVDEARQIAEKGACAALQHLAVDQPEPFPHLTPEQRELRNKLRAKGRQLGDTLDARGRQRLDALVTEVAYEYWHRMLFACFLAENHLLMHPEGVSVSLDDCDELAAEEGFQDGWTLAAHYASRMLPQIFRQDDPVLEVTFAPEHKKALEKLLSDLPREVFLADDSLGWVYQFWQKRRKDEINASDEKIDGKKLPAVTQLFTEHYMVQFLLDNTIGAWWVARHPETPPPIDFPYLRRLEDGCPAAGTFPGWPDRLAELKVLDPCMGSGHILVTALYMVASLRMVEEGLSAQEAVDSVLQNNLFGLEIDPRCTQIAAFALALTAAKFPNAGGYRELPELNVACCGIAPHGKREEWRKLGGEDIRLQNGMSKLYDTFQQASELGSLINPQSTENDLYTASFAELRPLLNKALESEKSAQNYEQSLRGIVAQGLSRTAELLADHYHLVMTNVPYLKRGNQSEFIRTYCEKYYPETKNDLATVFVERCIEFCVHSGATALVAPQNWLFLVTYKKMREKMLHEITWNLLARLGPGAFETISGHVVNVALYILTYISPSPAHLLVGIDASLENTPLKKANALLKETVKQIPQSDETKNPDLRILLENLSQIKLLEDYADSIHGLTTGDLLRMQRNFWEFQSISVDWVSFQSTVNDTCLYGGRESLLYWCDGTGPINELPGARKDGLNAWGKRGVVVRQMGHLPVTLYTGEAFDNNTAVILPKNPEYLPAIWAFCLSEEFYKAVRRIDKKLSVTSATLVKIPFNLERWQKVAEEMEPLPEPYSADPTQWLFKGDISTSTSPLHVAVACLLGYHWPDQSENSVLDQLEDTDGIVCLPAVSGELPAADRFREFLATAYSERWSADVLAQLLSDVGCAGWTLEKWLREKFFEQHCKLFHQRPFLWHIWDGRRNGFAALVNYHKLDHKRLERLTYTYLNDWIRRQEDRLKHDESGAEGLLIAARQLQERLKLILEGEPPYDIFVRWKPLEEQPIGWNPDLNDGVRLNIRPFVEANILRKKPNIKWKKDRGKNPPGGPWGEERHNDLHLTNAEKREAREALKHEKALLSSH